jgi:FixJ family two-component response regulator
MSEESIQDAVEPVVDPEFGPWLAQASILVVDDEPGMRNFLVKILRPRCKLIEEAASTNEATRKLDTRHFDVVILDNVMPGKTGLDWLAEQPTIGFFVDVILMTAYADLDTAIEALRTGVVDFVIKPFRSNQLLNAVARCLDRTRLQRENHVLRHELKSASREIFLRNKLLGDSAAVQQVRDTIARAWRHCRRPCCLPASRVPARRLRPGRSTRFRIAPTSFSSPSTAEPFRPICSKANCSVT